MIAINKVDIEAPAHVTRALADYRHAMRIVRGDGHGPHTATDARVVACSGLTGAGLDDIWRAAQAVRANDHAFTARRQRQLIDWLWSSADAALLAEFHSAPAVTAQKAAIEADVLAGKVTPANAAVMLRRAFQGR